MRTRRRPPAVERREQERRTSEEWRTALTCIEPNKILMRGYPLDEIMGRLTFGEAIYLLLMGEVPSPAIGSLMEAMLVSFIDHGATPPSTLAARNTATTGAPLRACVAAGRARLRPLPRRRHRELHAVSRHRASSWCARARPTARPPSDSSSECLEAGEAPPGFGHRFHTRDPRAARLFQMALELEVEGDHIQMIRAVELVLHGALPDEQAAARSTSTARSRPSAATSASRRDRQRAVHHLARPRHRGAGPGRARARDPMRQIDPKDHIYDGPSERRLPERRK